MARDAKSSRIDLHEELSQRTYHNAVLCTYTFDPRFFEDYCLERFSALSMNNNISVCIDGGRIRRLRSLQNHSDRSTSTSVTC